MEMTIAEQLVGLGLATADRPEQLNREERKQERVALKTEKKKQHRLQVERQREQRAR
jgi:hypothetical protein